MVSRKCVVYARFSALDEESGQGGSCVGKDKPYSNLSAATILGNPETKTIISQGRRLSRDVRAAPPLDSPLCCFRRRGGFGVEPMYRDACLTVERRT